MPSYQHPFLGKITLNPSKKARRLSISIRPGGEIRLTFPHRINEKEALRFLNEKIDWVTRTQQRMAKQYVHEVIVPPYSTRSHSLYLDPRSCVSIRIRVQAGRIVVSYPAQMQDREESIQTAIRRGIEEAWRLEAKVYLPKRVEQLSQQTGLSCGKVTIRNARTRWGSCSVNNDISLSLHLMKLPDPLIDYIILHELCHTRHKNHGPRFHALLNRLCGGQETIWRKELKNYSTRW